MGAVPESVRVLYFDPSETAETIAAGLEAQNDRLKVDIVADFETALHSLNTEAYDCVVADCDLPDRTGLELFDSVNSHKDDLPFILYSSTDKAEVARTVVEAGITVITPSTDGSEGISMLADRIDRMTSDYGRSGAETTGSERVHRFIEESSDVIAVVAPDGTFNYLSPTAERVLGYEPEELLGEVGFDCIHPADLEEVERQFVSMIEDPDRRPSAEFRFDHADGDWRWLEARGRNLVDDPAVGGLVVYVRDVTERKEAERELRTVRDRMEFALEATDSVIFEVDLETGAETRHGPFERLYGIPPAGVETFDRFLERAVHPGDRDRVESAERRAAGDRPGSVEFEYRTHPDAGPVRWIHSRAFVQADDGTERLIGLATDITSLKEREAELERQNGRLDQFASMVSHDLRNPLSVATGRLELAREEVDTEHHEPLAKALARMDALIEDLLGIARAAKAEVELEPVDLAGAAEATWANVATNRASLAVETDRTVLAEGRRLNRLLENLFRNAVDHAGPAVAVRVGDLEDGFFVEDDGPGIPSDEQSAVFEPGHSSVPNGSGLGLSIVEHVADDHGWTCRLTEATDGGARFEFTGVEFADG